MEKYVLYGAGKLGRQNYDFLKRHKLEKYIEAFCDKNYREIRDYDGVPVKPYNDFDNSTSFIISIGNGIHEVEEMLKADGRKYYYNFSSWIFDCMEEADRDSLYLEYTNAGERWKRPNVVRIEGAQRARRELMKFSAMNIAKEEVVKVGTEYGGWTIPKDFYAGEEDCILCAGAGEDISFDCEMAERNLGKVIILDPTPRAVEHFKSLKSAVNEGRTFYVNRTNIPYSVGKQAIGRIKYLPIGLIGGKDRKEKFYFPQNEEHVSCSAMNLQDSQEYFEAECYTYKSLLKKLNVPRFKLIKIDIEGMEYEVINSIIKSKVLPDVLCVDFDETNIALDLEAEARIRNTIELLMNNGMKPIWVEGDSATFVSED
jgi:FkbM family methyltransferase